jgi:predicted MFS family arabinose efflux permease
MPRHSHTVDRPGSRAPLYWLALGTFAVGTEGFMVAALLPNIAHDLGVTIRTAGQLITAFTLAYAVSSPILTALTGGFGRRRLLIVAMGAFAVGNVIAGFSPNYPALVTARIVLAFAAGLYVPGANALASVLVPPEQRGRALGIINGGITLAIALGVPLGAVVGDAFGWRMSFIGVAAISFLALGGLLVGLQSGVGADLPVSTLAQRARVLQAPGIASALGVTTIWATGGYTVYTYIAPLFFSAAALSNRSLGIVLFVWGLCAAGGVAAGGFFTDRWGSNAVVRRALPVLAVALASLSVIPATFPAAHVLIPMLIGVGIWGISAWAFFPAQQAHLVSVAGPGLAPIVLSLNASSMYFGFSLGALMGTSVLTIGSTRDLGWVGGLCISLALALFSYTSTSVLRQIR